MPDVFMAFPAYPASPLLAMALLSPKADPTSRSKAQSTYPMLRFGSTQPPTIKTPPAANAART